MGVPKKRRKRQIAVGQDSGDFISFTGLSPNLQRRDPPADPSAPASPPPTSPPSSPASCSPIESVRDEHDGPQRPRPPNRAAPAVRDHQGVGGEGAVLQGQGDPRGGVQRTEGRLPGHGRENEIPLLSSTGCPKVR